MPQWNKDLIFVIVFIGENLGEDRFYIWENSSIQEIIFSNYQSLLQTHNGIRPRHPNSRHCAYSGEEDLSFKHPLKVALRADRIEIERDQKLLFHLKYFFLKS